MDELDALGIGEQVRKAAPALTALRLSYDEHEALLPNREGRTAYCLRREKLDGLLQQAAVDAGAELLPQTRVLDLVREQNGMVSGVMARQQGQTVKRLHADLVVGADGRNSTIAELVGAQEYLGYDAPRAAYWAYWRRPPGWNQHEFYNSYKGTDIRVIFPTDDDQILIATVPPVEQARAWRADHVAAYIADIRAYEQAASFLGEDGPVGEVRGVFRTRYFFRSAVGPGWALIGDAAHHKEFVVGLGISDALRDARGLATAILEGGAGAFERWWRQRDVERIEMFHWARELGDARAVDALQRLVLARMTSASDLQERFADVLDGRLPPYDLVPSARAVRWVAASLRHGGAATLSPLHEVARRRAQARRDLRRFQQLLSSA